MRIPIAVLAGILPLGVSAQQPKPTPATSRFDVVVIKPATSGGWGVHMEMHDGTLQITNLPLKSVITSAYGVREDLITGLPSWAQAVRYDITAKMDPEDAPLMNTMTRVQRRALIAALLQDRFKLKIHTETRLRPVYELVLLGNTPRFPEHAERHGAANDAQTPSGIDSVRAGAGEFTATGVRLPILTSFLEENLETSIIDKTGLRATYDFKLRWSPEMGGTSSGEEDAPSLFTALQDQLGLKLRPAKGQVETLVVDQIDQPSAN